MKKKLVSAMLVLSMCSSLVACGNSGANDDVVGTEAGTESASATDGSGESEISMPDVVPSASSSGIEVTISSSSPLSAAAESLASIILIHSLFIMFSSVSSDRMVKMTIGGAPFPST